MIDHLHSNKGKRFLYVLPITPYPYNKVTNYSVAIVEIKTIYNNVSKIKVISVVNESKSWPALTFAMKHNTIYTVSNKYLYELFN